MSQLDGQCLSGSSLFTSSKGRNVEYAASGEQHPYRGQELLYERWDQVRELESVMAGSDLGRQSAGEVTVFFGNGAGIQVAALGHEVLRLARARGLGRQVELGLTSLLAAGA
jgi:ornithine cyclodeaminase/alanine dehydrogenase-like protein (mu-crystallin family)